jgi:predicted permease
MFETWVQDVRFAGRLLRRSPVFTAVAAVSLAVGIGANTAIFTVVNALLLRPRPGLVEAGLVDVARYERSSFDNMSYPNYADYRDASQDVFLGLAAYRLEPQPLSLTREGAAIRIFGMMVSGNYFEVLGVRPAQGRFFLPEEDATAGERLAAVASHRFWQNELGGDPAAVGGSLTLNGQTFTLVGIAPREFTGTSVLTPDVWVPLHALTQPSMFTERRAVWLLGIGRLRPGVSIALAQAALSTVASRLERAYPESNREQGVVLRPSAAFPGEMAFYVTAFLGLLMALAGLILLIASANVAGILLARATTRRREIAVRLAVGASRGRLVRQMLVESVMLVAIGGGAGLVLAVWLRALAAAFIPHLPFPVTIDLTFDVRVLAFAVGVSLATGILAGLVPALQASRDHLAALRDEAQATGRRGQRVRNGLVAAQVALALLLVVTAGLMLRALQHAGRIDPGFDPADVEIASFDLRLAALDDARGLDFGERLLERVRALPNVERASLAIDLPLDGGGFGFGAIEPVGKPNPTPDGSPLRLDWNVVSPDFFETMRIRLVEGRTFRAEDRAGAPPVAIVNDTLARQLWPGESAIGKRLVNRRQPFDTDIEMEVVGVERALKYRSLGEAPRNFIYVPLAQRPVERVTLIARRAGGPSLLPAVRAIVRDLNPNLPIVDAQDLTSYIAIGLMPQRIALSVAGSLGLAGLLLAAVGIYGVTAYSVARRTREIGIRMALGASRKGVMRLVLRQGLRLAGVGIGVGLFMALAASRALASLLYGIGAADPATYAAAALVFTAIALAATWIPARRAAAIEPMRALREE